jgi:hypothetical protein
MYQSSYVRYERNGDRVTPVLVAKKWVNPPEKSAAKQQKFTVVRVSQLQWGRMEREPAVDAEGHPVLWQSSSRVETRERLMTLWERGDENCEPIVREAGYDQHWLPQGKPPFVGDAYGWTLDNGNGWVDGRTP